MEGSGSAPATPDARWLREIIDGAVTALCLLAEEIESRDRELAERIWDLANEHLELPLRVPSGRAYSSPSVLVGETE